METAPLKSFATWARTALIREVNARLSVVLAPASPERVEQPKAVEALENAVVAAGGDNTGKTAVADRVAYTWFNRIIALRFMDANGYTGIGVVSPQAGLETGQPEILAEAKRGNIDAAVVVDETRAAIAALLDGTRRSDDAQGEAYALLLTDYCRYWNRAMPFMFERAGDFTELLIPANLLADDSVPSRAVNVLTTTVCQDVEVIGWLYQFYISERHDEVFAGFKKNKKAGADEIPAATQLFTPHWIVRYLVENSLGRLWMLNHPSSRLVDEMEYYIASVDVETDFLKITRPEELTVIDPACGSGHMLTYAFDLLYAIYEEEGYASSDIPGLILANNLYGTEIDPRAGALAAFALTMKARARQRTFFSKRIEPNVCVIEATSFDRVGLDVLVLRGEDDHEQAAFWSLFAEADTLGSLVQPDSGLTARLGRHVKALDDRGDLLKADAIQRGKRCLTQAEYLSNSYSVVVTNPPYMGSGNMDALVSARVRQSFPDEKQDLYSCFVTRCARLTTERGLVAMVIGDTWMTIKSFEKFRKNLLRSYTFETFIHLHDVSNHPDIFGANAAFVFSKIRTHHQTCTFVYLNPNSGEAKRHRLIEAVRNPDVAWSYRVDVEQFNAVPGAPIAYWLSKRMVEVFQEAVPLSDIAEVKHGLSTGKNAAVVRHWWEVAQSDFGIGFRSPSEALESRRKWFPYNKGGDYRRWFGNFEYALRYDQYGIDLMATFSGHRHDGKSHYFREGITWTFISSAFFAVRYTPAGSIFDVSGSSLFPDEPKVVLALMCSDLASEFMMALNPTLNFQVGNVKSIPYLAKPISAIKDEVSVIADRAIQLHAEDWNSYETSWDFASPRLRGTSGSLAELDARDRDYWSAVADEAQELDSRNNQLFRAAYAVAEGASHRPPRESLSLRRVPNESESTMRELVSYAVGCMFGRYSLDRPGLILADQGDTVEDYLAKVPAPTFAPDADNVIPIVYGDWFEDDIVARFRSFLRTAFGEQHFEENLRFVTEALGVKDIRDYFVRSFYEDHWKRYKKRPIYWLFSSPTGSFNALIYMHRYTPSTASTVLNEYLREFQAKLSSNLQQHEGLASGSGTPRQQAAAQKEADRLRKVLLELEEYEHDVLYPLASRQLAIDLDDGVKANYPKFGAALKKIAGLGASDE